MDHEAIAKELGPYPSKAVLGQSCWVVANGVNAQQLHTELAKAVTSECNIVVSAINGDVSWSRSSTDFHTWMQRQLARVTF